MKEEKYFSLVMPLYNSKNTLEEAIQSILDQSYKNYELILVDDCSTDGSYEIAKKFAAENKKITLFRMEKNKGAPYCMNFGIKMAKYEWIGIIDSDAIATKYWLKLIDSNISNNTEVIGGKCLYTYPKNTGYFNIVFYYVESTQFPDTDQTYNKRNYSEPCIAGSNFFFKREVFNKNKGFNEGIKAGYDRLFLCDAVENGFTVTFLANSVVYHPLYNYKNIFDIFSRSIIFNKWRITFLDSCNLISKKYRIVDYFLISLLIYITIGAVVVGFINMVILSSILFFNSIIFLIFYIHLKRHVPYKYAFGYIFAEIIKKILGVFLYIFRLKSKNFDWKKR